MKFLTHMGSTLCYKFGDMMGRAVLDESERNLEYIERLLEYRCGHLDDEDIELLERARGTDQVD